MTKSQLMGGLVEKMQSPDQDHRYMGLTDLMNEVKQDASSFLGDENVEARVLRQVLGLVEDKISEVKNLAVKCLGVLMKILKERQIEFVIENLIAFSSNKDEELRDIAGLALKTITAELPQDSKLAPQTCAKLTPELLNQLSNPSTPPETLIEYLSILSILTTRFSFFVVPPGLQPQPIVVLSPLLNHPRPAVRKRAIVTMAQILPLTQKPLVDHLFQSIVIPGVSSQSPLDVQRTSVSLVAGIARHASNILLPSLPSIVPDILKVTTKEDEELREVSLQTLEVLVLKYGTEMTPYLTQIIQIANQLIKYDPNYAGDDDGDGDEDMDEDNDDDDEDLDEYSDDEDTSYKIRRSATKLLASLIATRPEILATLLKDVSPVLISRFGDREETVKLEVWATYSTLLNQTLLYGGLPQTKTANAAAAVGGKRKRDSVEGMDIEGTLFDLLKSQVPSMAKALLGQVKGTKTPANVLQASFNLLTTLINVLPGSLSNDVTAITSTAQRVLSQPATVSNSTLRTTCLSFLSLFFGTHSPPTFVGAFQVLIPSLLQSLAERHPRVVSESFGVFSSLLTALKPVKTAEWLDTVYEEAVKRLRSSDTDGEVREKAEAIIGDLWICAPEFVKGKDGKEWDAMCRSTGRLDGAVRVVTRVAQSVDVSDQWISGSIEWILSVLRRSGKSGKVEIFIALDSLLRKHKAELPAPSISELIEQMRPYLTTHDISLLSHALTILSLLLQLSPVNSFSEIERDQLTIVCDITHSPLITGAPLDSLLSFFGSLVDADNQIATHLIPNLVNAHLKAPKTEASGGNVAKCIGQIVKSQRSLAAGTIAEFSRHIKKESKAKESQVLLSLLVFGELGRFIDFSPQKEVFERSLEYFSSTNEEIRSAASFAAGNIAIGNLSLFLPVLLKLVQNDQEKRLLGLHALKEVVSNCLHGHLEGVAESIWVPLFEQSASSDDATRNVAAACLGRLTTADPARYLPQLEARLHDPEPSTRATTVAAIRYTFADTSNSFDELLSPLVMDFLTVMTDSDLTVRRLAISALNSAARNKPHLVRDHMNSLLPGLYKETVINQDLIRTVQLGPWTHKVDDGLETRKTAYETMYTLLDTCLAKIDLHEFERRVITGLSDDSDEVKVISHMMLFRLSQVAPTSVAQVLDEITPRLEQTMKGPAVTKDTVKQDLERAAELQRSALRAAAALAKVNAASAASGTGSSTKFESFVAQMEKGPWAAEFKEWSRN